jgi:hypothetical protein
MGLLRILSGLVSVVSSLLRLFEGWKMRKEARTVAHAEIKMKEAEIDRASTEVLHEPRDPSSTAKRLRDGTF